MGKVYDALRKAEAQREERRMPPGAVPQPRSAIPAGASRSVARDRRSPLAGLVAWLRRDPGPRYLDDAGDMNKRRFALLQPDSFVAEQFRMLRARIDALSAERPLRTLAIASALGGEGKTTAAVNLALVSAMAVGRRVLLVDCDMRRPRIHAALGLRPEFGLAEVLTDAVSPDRAICKVDGSALEVLPVRSIPENPAELLGSARMRPLMSELATAYDLVILDTPPVLALPDAKILAEIVDGVVLVVKADSTPDADVEAAMDVLDRRRLLGVVLNGAQMDVARYGY